MAEQYVPGPDVPMEPPPEFYTSDDIEMLSKAGELANTPEEIEKARLGLLQAMEDHNNGLIDQTATNAPEPARDATSQGASEIANKNLSGDMDGVRDGRGTVDDVLAQTPLEDSDSQSKRSQKAGSTGTTRAPRSGSRAGYGAGSEDRFKDFTADPAVEKRYAGMTGQDTLLSGIARIQSRGKSATFVLLAPAHFQEAFRARVDSASGLMGVSAQKQERIAQDLAKELGLGSRMLLDVRASGSSKGSGHARVLAVGDDRFVSARVDETLALVNSVRDKGAGSLGPKSEADLRHAHALDVRDPITDVNRLPVKEPVSLYMPGRDLAVLKSIASQAQEQRLYNEHVKAASGAVQDTVASFSERSKVFIDGAAQEANGLLGSLRQEPGKLTAEGLRDNIESLLNKVTHLGEADRLSPHNELAHVSKEQQALVVAASLVGVQMARDVGVDKGTVKQWNEALENISQRVLTRDAQLAGGVQELLHGLAGRHSEPDASRVDAPGVLFSSEELAKARLDPQFQVLAENALNTFASTEKTLGDAVAKPAPPPEVKQPTQPQGSAQDFASIESAAIARAEPGSALSSGPPSSQSLEGASPSSPAVSAVPPSEQALAPQTELARQVAALETGSPDKALDRVQAASLVASIDAQRSKSLEHALGTADPAAQTRSVQTLDRALKRIESLQDNAYLAAYASSVREVVSRWQSQARVLPDQSPHDLTQQTPDSLRTQASTVDPRNALRDAASEQARAVHSQDRSLPEQADRASRDGAQAAPIVGDNPARDGRGAQEVGAVLGAFYRPGASFITPAKTWNASRLAVAASAISRMRGGHLRGMIQRGAVSADQVRSLGAYATWLSQSIERGQLPVRYGQLDQLRQAAMEINSAAGSTPLTRLDSQNLVRLDRMTENIAQRLERGAAAHEGLASKGPHALAEKVQSVESGMRQALSGQAVQNMAKDIVHASRTGGQLLNKDAVAGILRNAQRLTPEAIQNLDASSQARLADGLKRIAQSAIDGEHGAMTPAMVSRAQDVSAQSDQILGRLSQTPQGLQAITELAREKAGMASEKPGTDITLEAQGSASNRSAGMMDEPGKGVTRTSRNAVQGGMSR